MAGYGVMPAFFCSAGFLRMTGIKPFLFLFLTVTFVAHGLAFTFLGLRRRKMYYFLMTGTFTFLTAIYFIKFEGWLLTVPGSDFPLTWVLRIAAGLCTLAYLWRLRQEEGSWLRRLMHGRSR